MNNNQNILKKFIVEYLGERLVDYKCRYKQDSNSCSQGRMYFPQETVKNEQGYFYKTFNGMRKINDVLNMMKKYKSSEEILNLEMMPVGKYMGSTHCRYCKESLGNGHGYVTLKQNNKNMHFSLTGGADHYLKHGIGLNLISYLFFNKEKKVKAHITFVGEINDIQVIENYILKLENTVKLKI